MKPKRGRFSIEPGILPVLRAFAFLQLLLAGVGWLRGRRALYFVLSRRFPALADWLAGSKLASGFYFIWIGVLLLLILFLFLPQFPRWLKRYYLPLALIFQIGILIVQHDLIAFIRLSETPGVGIGTLSLQMFLFFSVPILLASWQYAYRYVLALIVFSSAWDLFIVLILAVIFDIRAGTVVIGIIVRTLLYAVIGYIVAHLMAEQRKLRASLQAANQKLNHYVSTLDALATARERNRLARELHDTLAHSLSGLVIQLEAINILWEQDPQQAHVELAASTEQARNGLNEARRAIKSLRAAPLEEMGLWLALQQAAEDAAQRGAFEVELVLPKDAPPLPPQVENDLYRVVAESLENIVRHAHAEHVLLSLTFAERRLRLQVRDDGVGFDPAAVGDSAHFGLLGLRERAELQGAVFEVESRPGAGTTIRFQMELPE